MTRVKMCSIVSVLLAAALPAVSQAAQRTTMPALWRTSASVTLVQATPGTPQTFHGEGRVIAAEPFGRLKIDGPIDGIMDAMVMMYKVRPASLSTGIRAGDKVEFQVDKSYTIVSIKVVGHAP